MEATLIDRVHDLSSDIAVLKSELKSTKEALSLQAKEYERRLAELNREQYVSREAWELQNSKVDDWRRAVERWMYISIGAGLVGGGMAGAFMRALLK